MSREKAFNIIAVISFIGMIVWMATAFFGGMYIYFTTYGLLIIPVILLYNISFVDTFISIIKRGLRASRFKASMHGIIILFIWSILLIQSDVLKSKRIITATLKVDPYMYTVIFRANGVCESESFSMFGYKEFRRGRYKLNGDTIVFKKKPADIAFIPDTMLLDKDLQAIFFDKDQKGDFIKENDWPDHFDIK